MSDNYIHLPDKPKLNLRWLLLMAWRDRFEAAWPGLMGEKYDERFGRMWRYYLSTFAALFRARNISLWQVVLSPRGVPGGYASIR